MSKIDDKPNRTNINEQTIPPSPILPAVEVSSNVPVTVESPATIEGATSESLEIVDTPTEEPRIQKLSPPKKRPTKIHNLKAKEWLTNNKIYFETIGVVFFAVVAAYISLLQVRLVERQNDLVSLQAEIARQEAIPQFVITARQSPDKNPDIYTEDKIFIYNQGGLVRDFRCETAIFLHVGFTTDSTPLRPGSSEEADIPVYGYYFAHVYTGESKGLIMSITGYRNNQKAVQLERDFRSLASKRQGTGEVEVKRYLRLTYKDVFDREHIDYYYVPLTFGGSRLDPKEGQQVFLRHNQAFGTISRVNFDDLTPRKLLQMMHISSNE